ncbi:MCE family protein [Mycobacterium intracellulare]|uniref:MCE family protein n=1 Tax=Mycobacterium intracellulare TaxID=1767 RepID=UPI001CDAFFBE|nr:MCE family protein [Mycobacterium intracellulare]MCA2255990.1 MCE family protein [Mycobacterium intracellulare]
MRALEGSNRLGLIGVIVLLLTVAVAQSFTSVPMLFATPTYYALFADTAGLRKGDKVQIAGIDVGTVRSLRIHRGKVVIEFTLGDAHIGTESHAAIRTSTIFGRKNISIENHGSQRLSPGGTLPATQTTTPYQIYDAFNDTTNVASGWDIDTVKHSLDVLSQTIDQTSPHLSAALDGVKRFSDTIGSRDEQVIRLLADAKKVAGVLGDRSEQINKLVVNAQTVLATLNERGRAVDLLLSRVVAFERQVKSFIAENPNLNRVLEQLRVITDVLNQRKNDLATTVQTLSTTVTGLGESVSSGPFLKILLANLLPNQVMQPWVDAAFKKRGIDPEEFWRNAGLPAFRFPDPNGTRLPNGAPPPAPTPLEGTPDHPGPAVVPGSPCSYTPPSDGLPRPGNPLPCAELDQGPYGPVSGGYPAPVDVLTAPKNPSGLPPTPGIPIAGQPGQPPLVPGTPVPIPAQAPPGARTPLPVATSIPTPPAAPPPGPPGSGPQAPGVIAPRPPAPLDGGGN